MKRLLPFFMLFLISVTQVSAQTATSSATGSAAPRASTPSATSTVSATTTTKGGTVEMPDELPQTGSGHITLALILLGLLSVGIGLYTKYALPIVFEEE